MSKKPSKRTSAIVLSVVVAITVSLSGCGWWDTLEDSVEFSERELLNVEDILNRAIADIDANSENWQRILQTALDEVGDTERQVRQDLEELMQRGIHTAGLEARCDISYLGDMLVEGLQRIRATVLNEPPPPVRAVVCDASPSAIDMNLDPNRRNNVEVYGYNLDLESLKLYHVLESGQVNETTNFTITSPFKRIINLGSNGIALVPQSVKLRMDLGNGENRDVPVIQKWPDVCTTRDLNTSSASIQVIPTHVGPGDKDFHGNGPCTQATAQIYTANNGTELRAHIGVDMWECPNDMTLIHEDYTEGIKTEDRVLFTTEHDEEIIEIRTPTSASLEFISDGYAPGSKSDTGLVMRWDILGDTKSDDVGKSYVTVTLNSVHLVLRKKLDCVTEDELARMMQQDAMSPVLTDYVKIQLPGALERFEELERGWPMPIP